VNCLKSSAANMLPKNFPASGCACSQFGSGFLKRINLKQNLPLVATDVRGENTPHRGRRHGPLYSFSSPLITPFFIRRNTWTIHS